MGKANKSVKTAGKAASVKFGKNGPKGGSKGKPVLRAIKGGKSAPAKSPPPKLSPTKSAVAPQTQSKALQSKTAMMKALNPKPAPAKSAPTMPDDVPVIALNLDPVKLSPAMAAYFKKCQDRLGFVPNVLLAYAFDMAKLETFAAFYNDLMLGESGLSKLEREMIAVAVSSQNRCYYCLTAHGAAVRQYSGNPLLGEHLVMNYRAARLNKRQRAMLDFAVKLTASPWSVEGGDRERLRRAGFTDRDIWNISAVAGFFNMSNRVASATDMRPNAAYHGQAR